MVLSLASALTGCVLVGSQVSHLDLSPRFSGILYGILNGTGQLASIGGPLTAQLVVTDLVSIFYESVIVVLLIYCLSSLFHNTQIYPLSSVKEQLGACSV